MATVASGMAAGGLACVRPAPRRVPVPPEEAPHEMTLMQWPVSRKVHPNAAFLDLLQDTIADIANAIAELSRW